MRLVTCVGSKSSGKTCLLNILQENASDGKAFTIQEQDKIFSIWQEFNLKPKNFPTQVNGDKNNASKRKSFSLEHLRISNKVGTKSPVSFKKEEIDLKQKSYNNINTLDGTDLGNSKQCDYSELLGKTAPTIGVNHFEFIVDDLTLQVAGKYWKRKEREKNKIYRSIGCFTSDVNGDRIDGIELRELGGEIGKFHFS